LNAIVEYARTHQAILSRLLGGWGILGGLKVDVPESPLRSLLSNDVQLRQLSNNPQIIAGTKVFVSPGVAIDAMGHRLTVCDNVSLDIATLARQTAQGTITTQTCRDIVGTACSDPDVSITVSEFFLVAEFVETATRPAPQFSGGGPCDPAPNCEFSRKQEEVRFSLVPSIPDAYQFTGCIDAVGFTLPQVNLGSEPDVNLCRDQVFAFIDNVQGQLASLCCARPAVVLAKVMLTRDPGPLLGSLPPDLPLYTIVSDSYPCRKLTFQVGLFTKFFPNLICGGA
jgi:hypothetical protein